MHSKQRPMESHTNSASLNDIYLHLKTHLTPDILKGFVDKLNAVRNAFKGDGAGLSGGILSDKLTIDYLSLYVPEFREHHVGESDCAIKDCALSLKKINGKSTIALDWSKNPDESKKREKFENHILILNLCTEQWWKTAPKDASPEERECNYFTTAMPAGIYLVPASYCKDNVCLKSNNKTDTLIESIPLYKMLKHSMEQGLFIEFPKSDSEVKFNILSAFVVQ